MGFGDPGTVEGGTGGVLGFRDHQEGGKRHWMSLRDPGTVQGGPGGAQVLGPLPAQALLALGDSLAGSELKHLALPLGSPIPQRVLTQPFLAGALCTLHTSLTVINAFHSLIP